MRAHTHIFTWASVACAVNKFYMWYLKRSHQNWNVNTIGLNNAQWLRSRKHEIAFKCVEVRVFWRLVFTRWLKARNEVRDEQPALSKHISKSVLFAVLHISFVLMLICCRHKVRAGIIEVTGYRLDERGSFLGRNRDFSFRSCVRTGCGAYPASSPIGTRGSDPSDNSAGAWNWPLTWIWCRD